ncbi:hypothetical protein J2P12_07870 [Candidatus Bathyarchaeota archaeon]|nr:hypothetical protein [Candidatus Bathyarchaeota archaeon]
MPCRTVQSNTTDYLFAGNLRIGKIIGSSVSYYQSDELGSTRIVRDSFQAPKVLFAYNYQPFGLSAHRRQTIRFMS